ncbi:MAG: GNAT family N-acetyltransferase [Phormidesmis sp.]
MNIQIREASQSEQNEVLSIEHAAFGNAETAELVSALLKDPSAQPLLSLLAWQGDRAVGHILFTAAQLTDIQQKTANSAPNDGQNDGQSNSPAIALLAPLAVIPEAQNQGIGTQLIKSGLQRLSQAGVALVFVLGYPEYYTRHGFSPAGARGFEAPYPIPEKHTDAWMIQELRPNVIDQIAGKIVCADALNQPELWRE